MLKHYTGFDTSVLQQGIAVEVAFQVAREKKLVNFLIMKCSEMNLKLIDNTGEIVNISPKEVEDKRAFIRILK